MSKALFFNIPAHGHIYPTLPLIADLVRRGEEVIYYSSNAFRQVIGIPAICSMTTFAIPSLTMKNIRQLLKSPSDTRLLLLRAADEIQMFKSRSSIQ